MERVSIPFVSFYMLLYRVVNVLSVLIMCRGFMSQMAITRYVSLFMKTFT